MFHSYGTFHYFTGHRTVEKVNPPDFLSLDFHKTLFDFPLHNFGHRGKDLWRTALISYAMFAKQMHGRAYADSADLVHQGLSATLRYWTDWHTCWG